MNQIQVIDALAWAWLLLAGISTLYVAWDQRQNPEARRPLSVHGAPAEPHLRERGDDVQLGLGDVLLSKQYALPV
jgi:hypothetical protein